MVKKKPLDETFMIEEYIKNKKSAPVIAKEMGVSGDTLWRRLKKYNIQMRKGGFPKGYKNPKKGKKLGTNEEIYGIEMAKKIKEKASENMKRQYAEGKRICKIKKGFGTILLNENDEVKVINLYYKLRSGYQVAKIMNYSGTVIYRILKKNNIPILKRHHSEETKSKTREKMKERWKNPSWDVKERERKISESNKGRKCWSTGLTKETSEIIRKTAEKNTGRKQTEESKKKISLKNRGKERDLEFKKRQSANMQGIPVDEWTKFISREPYSQNWDNRFKRAIRKRDNYVCMLCGVHSEKLNRILDIHHVNYDKQLTIPQNCISLCRKCHALTQINREMWTKTFQDKLSKLYDYLYENGNVILNYKQLELGEIK